MIGLHRVFRNAGADGPDLIRTADTAERTALVASYLTNVLSLLRSHHEGEDEIVTPRLKDRASASEVADVERIAAQHEPVIALIDAAHQALSAWESDPSPARADHAAASVIALNDGLTPHLDEEEAVVLPIAGRYLTAPEWGELPSHGMRTYAGDKLWLIMGLIREQMTAQQIANMDAHMPPPVKEMWEGMGQRSFTEFAGQLRGVTT